MRAHTHSLVAGFLLAIFVSSVSMAAIEPISGAEAGKNNKPPYMLQSITVGDYSVSSALLATGKSTGESLFGTSITAADDFDLNTVATRLNTSKPLWQITMIDGQATWTDTNGDFPDFFVFEAGMNDSFVIQAILPGGIRGEEVTIPVSAWGDTGLDRRGLYNSGHSIGGVAIAVTDLLDSAGVALTNASTIEGIRIKSATLDPVSFVAVVPEPATVALLGLGSLIMLKRRRS